MQGRRATAPLENAAAGEECQVAVWTLYVGPDSSVADHAGSIYSPRRSRPLRSGAVCRLKLVP
jgi:hypothetical protein